MKCLFTNYDTGEILAKVSRRRYKDLSDFTDVVYKKQKEKDILGIGHPCELVKGGFGLGIMGYIHGRGYSTNIYGEKKIKDVIRVNKLKAGINSFIYGVNKKEAAPPKYVKYYDEQGEVQTSNVRIGVYGYPEGYVINVGKNNYSIFGTAKMYFDKITSRNFHSKGIDRCRRFNDLKAMLKYVKDHQSTFEFMVKKDGYSFSWEYASPEFKSSTDSLPKRKKESEALTKDELDELFNEINQQTDSNMGYIEVSSENANENEIKREILQRMDKLDFHPDVAKKFQDGILMQSEMVGILYDLNEHAKKAVSKIESHGYTPYHVVVTNTTVGELYAVLFATPNAHEWSYERPDNRGCVYAYVYNKDEPLFSEFGDILINPANGGLVRTA